MKIKALSVKRSLLCAIIAIASVCSAPAQHYRGFVDGICAFSVSNSNGQSFEYGGLLSLGATTSHGIQLKKLFLGLGAGVLNTGDDGGFGLPMFVDGRWDFFNHRNLNIYVGCKMGYYVRIGDPVGAEMNYILHYRVDNSIYQETDIYSTNGYASPTNSFYIQPNIGIRFRLTSTLGINLGISYIPLRMQSTFDTSEYLLTQGIIQEDQHLLAPFTSHRIAINLGVDF